MGWGGHHGHGAGTPLSHHHYHQHHPHHHHQHGHGSGRTWTVSGSSLANMFPEQLRVPKRRDAQSANSSSTPRLAINYLISPINVRATMCPNHSRIPDWPR